MCAEISQAMGSAAPSSARVGQDESILAVSGQAISYVLGELRCAMSRCVLLC